MPPITRRRAVESAPLPPRRSLRLAERAAAHAPPPSRGRGGHFAAVHHQPQAPSQKLCPPRTGNIAGGAVGTMGKAFGALELNILSKVTRRHEHMNCDLMRLRSRYRLVVGASEELFNAAPDLPHVMCVGRILKVLRAGLVSMQLSIDRLSYLTGQTARHKNRPQLLHVANATAKYDKPFHEDLEKIFHDMLSIDSYLNAFVKYAASHEPVLTTPWIALPGLEMTTEQMKDITCLISQASFEEMAEPIAVRVGTALHPFDKPMLETWLRLRRLTDTAPGYFRNPLSNTLMPISSIERLVLIG